MNSDFKNFPLIMVIGSLTASFIFVVSSRIFMSGINILELKDFNNYFIVIGFAFLWVASIQFFETRLPGRHQLIKFSVAWLIPLVFIIIFGALRYQLPIEFIGYIGLFIFFNFLMRIKLNERHFIKGYSFGFLFTFIYILTGSFGFFPWVIDSHAIGAANTDTYRDAAFLQGWYNYGVQSFGVHGLMRGTYHPLYTLFYTPFLKAFSLFEAFHYFSFIVTPSIFLFGWTKLLIHSGSILEARRAVIILILFALILPLSIYFSHVRSFSISHLFSISLISILLSIFIINDFKKTILVVALAFLVPFITMARAFDGLFWIVCLLSLGFLFSGLRRFAIIILAIINFGILYLYYSSSERATEGTLFNGPKQYLMENWMPLAFTLPVFAVLMVYFYIKVFKEKTFANQSSADQKFEIFCFSLSVAVFMLFLRTPNSSDAFFQISSYFILLFFLLTTKNHIKISLFIQNLDNNNGAKYTISIALFILISFLGHSFSNAMNFMKEEREFFSHYSLSKEKDNTCESKILDPFCTLRTKIFGFSIDWESIELAPSNLIINNINNIIKSDDMSDNNIGIYIDPNHKFWHQNHKRSHVSTLLIMAETGKPLIFGVPEELDNSSSSINKAKKYGGTLKNINFTDLNKKLFCEELKILDLNGFIKYDANSNDGDFFRCLQ